MSEQGITVDADFPGGNIVLERIEGDHVYLQQDLRDTEGEWFYWYFGVRGAAGRSLQFHFTAGDVLGVRGPGMSLDGGRTWEWLGSQAAGDGSSFHYSFPRDAEETRFSMTLPYLACHLQTFCQAYADHPSFLVETLCQSRHGRPVERLRLGCLEGTARHRVLFTARHHACESVASYALEGAMAAMLADTPAGRWLRDHVELAVLPFMDKDGVQEGDQGKHRRPHDHNRDYLGESIYPEVAALRQWVTTWAEDKLRLAIDWHCPWITREKAYFVGGPDAQQWESIQRFSHLLADLQQGPLRYQPQDNIPFGSVPWNSDEATRSLSRWAAGFPNIAFASTLEIPYGKSHDDWVNAAAARAFGADIMQAISAFLQGD